MNETIAKIVNILFDDVAETEETLAMREEILNNCQERYQDLVGGGVDPDTATSAIVESLRGMEDVLSQYPRKGEVNTPADEQAFREVGFEAAAGSIPLESEGVEEYAFRAGEISSISCALINDDLSIGVSDDGGVHVLCDDDLNKLAVRLADGCLKIERKAQEEEENEEHGFHMEVEAANLGDFVRKIFSEFSLKKIISGVRRLNESMEITLLLPEGSNIDLNITSTSGDVCAEDVQMRSLRMTSTSGDVDMQDVVLDSLCITTTSGDADMSNVQVYGQMQLHTTSGDIDFEGSGKDLDINTVSGDVDMNGSMETAQIRTVSGDVDVTVENQSIRRFAAKSTSGELSLTLPEDVQADMNCRSVSGYVNQSHRSYPGAPVVSVHMQTVSGGICVY